MECLQTEKDREFHKTPGAEASGERIKPGERSCMGSGDMPGVLLLWPWPWRSCPFRLKGARDFVGRGFGGRGGRIWVTRWIWLWSIRTSWS